MRAVEQLLRNSEHVFRRDLRFHKHELRLALVEVVNAFVVASASWNSLCKHVLKNDRAWLHSTASVAYTGTRFIAAGVVVCKVRMTTADTKQSIAGSVRRARAKSEESAVIIRESAIHIRLLGVRNHPMLLCHQRARKKTLSTLPFFRERLVGSVMAPTFRRVIVVFGAGKSREIIYFPTNVKHVHKVRLINYRHIDPMGGAPPYPDLILHCPELETNNNEIISNRTNLNSKFALLLNLGAKVTVFPTTVTFQPPRNLPQLTFELLKLDGTAYEVPNEADVLVELDILADGS